MNRDLVTLRKWATDMSTTDPDVSARPLWGQVAREVDAYLSEDDRTPGEGAEPFDFGGPA